MFLITMIMILMLLEFNESENKATIYFIEMSVLDQS